MRFKQMFIVVLLIFFTFELGLASGVTGKLSVKNQLSQNQLTINSYFNNELTLKQDDDIDFREDIYEYQLKSPMKAFAYSLVLPGAGQYYLGKKYRAVTYLAVDALLWTGYLVYHGKGVDKENEYQDFADENYSWQTFWAWWNTLPPEDQDDFSHRMPWDHENNVPIFNHEYYENIGKYDQFQMGWGADGNNHPPPDHWMPSERSTYLDLRKDSNDAFSNAKTSAMISIANHLISAFDAAIGAKKYNKGGQRYSLKMDAKKIEGRNVPMLTFTAKF